MTNTMNTPIETLEHSYPFRVLAYSLRPRSGGQGKQRGGDGLVREIELLSDSHCTLLTDRRSIPPYGLRGGSAGKVGRNLLIRGGKRISLPAKINLRLQKGDRVRIETPGGGGWGRS
jgi:N-methylhydantoinase B